ncbi:hypothetical protein GCG54_00011737 [Colletotrichum gloeosporioides]|uniref:Zn(2)-C6 fungal-type domain-containing protein n=1 Tax=Colletotrichum gloeosporioides TaxID=474922 RepID=A0A8H4FD90_COLGL|nr:uncharacterized protein GCG54_00011737 [Colletotrichum gloeosporioides]KAF3797705.1 hypothetical protein GCG54_00011737 [Colletotrichum gloeosporioides]
MAPSTATPSDLHRAPVACLKCRAAKVRCLISRRPDRCDRCISNGSDCVFTQPKRARIRAQPYPQPRQRESSPRPRVFVSPQDEAREDVIQPTPSSHASPAPPTPLSHDAPHLDAGPQPPITAEIRARIIATLATLKGKRGAPFSFITSGDRPPFGASNDPGESGRRNFQGQASQPSQPSLKLSWLLTPLKVGGPGQATIGQAGPPVKMPTYSACMSLGQTITDPIDNGILSEPASIALFEHFMTEMNAKWEYVLDPHFDTHNDVRRRSHLLFATVLFCSSKFANYQDGDLSLKTDPFLQTRLCSLARNLAVRTFAEGDRSVETMQAFYLLVCWKDEDDDISYLHSGYAFQILHDLDLEQSNGSAQQTARRRRAWLALFRQDKQQSMFFMRRASLNLGDEEDSPRLLDLQTWLKMPHSLPLDFVACCSADLRRIQSKIRVMIPKASSTMLPCLSDLLDSELNRWKLTWQPHFDGKGRLHQNDDLSLDQRLLYSGQDHLSALVGVWEQSVRLNISSLILRQVLMTSVTKDSRSSELPSAPASSLGFPAMGEGLSTDTPGLANSVHGALGTLRQLLKFPTDDLRRSPDAVTLLAPNAALFLCLLLCLPCDGILGPSFQRTAVGLIKDINRHVKDMVRSPQDMVNLHAAYLESLANLLQPMTPQCSPTLQGHMGSDVQHLGLDGDQMLLEETELQAAHVLAGGMDVFNQNTDINNALLGFTSEPEQALHMQSFANLMDTSFFWDAPPMAAERSYD